MEMCIRDRHSVCQAYGIDEGMGRVLRDGANRCGSQANSWRGVIVRELALELALPCIGRFLSRLSGRMDAVEARKLSSAKYKFVVVSHASHDGHSTLEEARISTRLRCRESGRGYPRLMQFVGFLLQRHGIANLFWVIATQAFGQRA